MCSSSSQLKHCLSWETVLVRQVKLFLLLHQPPAVRINRTPHFPTTSAACVCRLLMQVAAHADGREAVNEYDCLLLEYVFGNRPDDCHKVRAQVLDIIASDPGLQQTELVFLGLFGR